MRSDSFNGLSSISRNHVATHESGCEFEPCKMLDLIIDSFGVSVVEVCILAI